MKRFAAHYVWSGKTGFQKQQVVEIEGGEVRRIFPLSEEIESVEWFSGVIMLTPEKNLTMEAMRQLLREPGKNENKGSLHAYLLYPFDFISMQPVCETRHRQLR